MNSQGWQPDMKQRPIFVVGMNGSGTTMLADSIGNHPLVYSMPIESKVLPYYLQHAAKFGNMSSAVDKRKFADLLGREKPFWQSNDKQDIILDVHALNECCSVAGIIAATFAHLARKNDKLHWCDKSPINTEYIGLLAEAFPESRFVHIIRDGRDAAQSFHRRWGKHPLNTIVRWQEMITSAREQGEVLGSARYMEILYEKVTLDPESSMRKVCKFLDLPFVDSVLHSSMQYMDKTDPRSRMHQIVPNSEKWRAYFEPATVNAMENLAGSLLQRLGYVVEINGSQIPGKVARQYWKLHDRVVFTIWHFREYGLESLPMYWKHVKSSIKQSKAERA